MDNKQSLISVSTLSYIWEAKQMDNVDLLKPFVLFSLSNLYDYGNREKIDEKKVADFLKNNFSFDNMPIGVVRKILERLCKKTNYIIRDNNDYYLVGDLSKEIDSFNLKHEEAQKTISFVLKEFKEKLISLNALKSDCSEIDVQNTLFDFLESNGYILIKNINTVGKIEVKNTKINLAICRIIIEEADNNSDLFNKFLKVVEGYMLSNVIYLQIENNNLASLKNLDVYFDSPLILEALGFKSEQSNKMTEEMMELLKKQRATIKCFTHNYKEVDGFLENYKTNRKNKNYKTKTIELFDENNFSEEQVDNVIIHLENLIKDKGIIIEESPGLDSLKHKENHNYVINYKEFKKYIKDNYQYNNRISDIFIENDIDSINSIAIIRKNERFKSIDECKAIFVTKNYDLVHLTNKYLEYKPFEEIGLIISDTDLITLLWQKNYNKNKDLPKIKILSNALAGYNPSANMLNKIRTIVNNMEKAGINDDNAIISNILSSHTKKVDLMELTDGNPNNLTEEKLLKVINKEKNREVYKLNKEIDNLKKQLEDLKKNDEQKEIEERKKRREKAEKITEMLIKIIKIIIKIILVTLFIMIVYYTVTDFIDEGKFKIGNFLLLFFTIGGYVISFVSPFNYFDKLVDNKKKAIQNYIYNQILKIKSKL